MRVTNGIPLGCPLLLVDIVNRVQTRRPDGVGQVGAKAASCAANNFPLRGGKGTHFQGGVRTAAFVAGGLIPAAVRGAVVGSRFPGFAPSLWLTPGHACDQ
jgi:hypothetical protein